MKNDDEKKVQVPYRLPEKWVLTLRELPKVVRFPQQQIIEDAMAALFGDKSPLIELRIKMVRQAIKKKQVPPPFTKDSPFNSLRGYEEAAMMGMAQQFTMTL